MFEESSFQLHSMISYDVHAEALTKSRQTYYMDLDIDHASDPDKCVILSTEELMGAIPDFDWKDSRSGRMIDEASAEKLRAMFAAAVEQKKDQIWSPDIKVLID